MPLTALCANLSRELIFSFIYPHNPPKNYINITWFTSDIMILVQALRFGRVDSPRLSAKLFYSGFVLMLLLACCTVLLVTLEFGEMADKYAALDKT